MDPRSRVLAAALICVASMGLGWRSSLASTGYQSAAMVLPTSQISPLTGDVWMGTRVVPGGWIEGDPMRSRRGFRSDVRVVLVPAAVTLAMATRRDTERTRRLARAAVVALAAIGLLALGRGMQAAALSMAMAVWLAGPVLWPGESSVWGARGRRTLA